MKKEHKFIVWVVLAVVFIGFVNTNTGAQSASTVDAFSGPLMEYFSGDRELITALHDYIQKQLAAGRIIDTELPAWTDKAQEWAQTIPIDAEARPMVERIKRYIARDGFFAIDMVYYFIGITDDEKHLIAVDSGR